MSTDPAGLYYAPTQPPWSGAAFKQYIVVGIVTGAGTGAIAGGIGAGPGAVGGGALGGISYAIDHTVNAVYVTCSDIIEAMRDLGEAKDRNSKKRRQNPELFPPRPLPPYNEWPCKGPASHY